MGLSAKCSIRVKFSAKTSPVANVEFSPPWSLPALFLTHQFQCKSFFLEVDKLKAVLHPRADISLGSSLMICLDIIGYGQGTKLYH